MKRQKELSTLPAPVRVGKRHKLAGVLRVFIPVLLVLLLFAGFMRLALPHFTVKEVEVRGASIYAKEELVALSGIRSGEEVLSVDLDRAISNILTACPYVRSVSATVHLTGKVVLRVTEEKNRMVAEQNGIYYAFSDEMKVLDASADPADFKGFLSVELPGNVVFRTGNFVRFGETSAWAKETLLTLLSHLRAGKHADEITAISVASEHNLSYTIADRYKVLIGDLSDLDKKDRLFESYLAAKGAESASPTTVDLRDPQKIIESPGF